jgi:hypothetical protein
VTRRGALLLGFVVAAMIASAAAAALRPPPAVEGRVVDARSGRVASGATVIHEGRMLRRFHSPEFRFETSGAAGSVVEARAPGYEPASQAVGGSGQTIVLALTPRSIPDLGGVRVEPVAKGGRLELPSRLLDGRGRVKEEFPAVALEARLIIASAEGTPLGFLDLEPHIDYAQPALALSLDVPLSEIERISEAPDALLLVSVKAGDSVVASRPFRRPAPGPGEDAAR